LEDFLLPPPVHQYIYLSTIGFTSPNDGRLGRCIKLCW